MHRGENARGMRRQQRIAALRGIHPRRHCKPSTKSIIVHAWPRFTSMHFRSKADNAAKSIAQHALRVARGAFLLFCKKKGKQCEV
jgi:hypothetical protein